MGQCDLSNLRVYRSRQRRLTNCMANYYIIVSRAASASAFPRTLLVCARGSPSGSPDLAPQLEAIPLAKRAPSHHLSMGRLQVSRHRLRLGFATLAGYSTLLSLREGMWSRPDQWPLTRTSISHGCQVISKYPRQPSEITLPNLDLGTGVRCLSRRRKDPLGTFHRACWASDAFRRSAEPDLQSSQH